MSPEAHEQADAHYAEAASWATDRNADIKSSRRVAWIVAIAAVLIALAEAIAIMLLTPLKTVVPYALLVDRQTGYVQALDPLEPGRVAPDSALTQSFLVQYVIGRESFDLATIQRDYRKVALWSTDAARADYVAAMQISNPDSFLARLPKTTTVETRVRSVSSLGPGAALVRFETARRERGAIAQPPQGWVAVVNYRYSNAPMSVEDRYVNPLGFQVTRYRRDAETPPVAEPVSDSPANSSANAVRSSAPPTPRPATSSLR
jgi:type IV secretion system protein VirB8